MIKDNVAMNYFNYKHKRCIPPLEGVIRWAIANADETIEYRNSKQ